jgi:two-component sensor histidine kinase
MLKFGLQNLRFRRITFLYYSIVSIFSVPSRLVKDNSTFELILISIGIGVLITVIALPMLWLVCHLNQRFDLGRRSIYLPLALVAIAGAIRGVILHGIISVSNLEDNLEPVFAVISSTIFTLIYFITISAFMETVLQRKEKFNRVFTEATLLVADPQALIGAKLDPKDLYDATVKDFKESISTLDLEKVQVSHEDLMAASKVIQNQINEVLRPLSHRLWVNGMGQVKHRGFLGILSDAIKTLDFNVKFILAYQFLVGGYGISLVVGFKSSLLLSTIGVLTSSTLIMIFLVLRQKLRNGHFLLGITFLTFVGVLPVFAAILIRNPLSEGATAAAGLLVSPTIPALILMVSTYRLVGRDRDFAIGAATSVRFQVAAVYESERSVDSGIELAEYLHNSLQSELFGIAKQLESAAQSQGRDGAKEVIRSLDAALSRNYQDISTRELEATMRIPQLISSWQGIANITVTGLEHLELESNLSRRASSTLEEMITNSIRYGEADDLQIELSVAGAELRILLTHNGKGEISKKSGLGSLLLAHHSESGVSIESKDGQTVLRLALPINSNA